MSWLNRERQIAYIVSDGPRRWKAVQEMTPPELFGKTIFLRHIPARPLPIRAAKPDYRAVVHFKDPFLGWEELVTARDNGKYSLFQVE